MRRILYLAVSAIIFTGCGDSFYEAQNYFTGPVEGVGLKKTTSIVSLEREQLYAVVVPSRTENKNVTWASSDESVATVDSNGIVTAVAVVAHGVTATATITVTTEEGRYSAFCAVTVVEKPVHVTAVNLNKGSSALLQNVTEQMTAVIYPSDATNQNLIWSSDNPQIVSVDSSGLVSSSDNTGTTTVRVRSVDGGFTASCLFTVSATPVDVAGISLNKTSTTVAAGKFETLFALITPSNATNQNITWSSSNDSIASVDTVSGTVTGVAVGGPVVITAETSNGKTASVNVSVAASVKAVTGVSLSKTSTTITVGTQEKLKAAISPADATNQNLWWKSDKSSVASVDSGGVVTAVSAGGAIITVSTIDGGFSKTCQVNVTAEPVYSVSYNGNEATTGTAPVDSTAYSTGATAIVLSKGTLGKAGYVFEGWRDVNDNLYQPGDTYQVNANVTFTASWTEVITPAYTVSFDPNGGAGNVPDSAVYNANSTVTVPGNTGTPVPLSKSGYTFSGWYANSTLYSGSNNTFIITSNVTLYAQWTPNSIYTATFNGNTNTDGQDPLIVAQFAGTTLTAPAGSTFAKTNFIFMSWNTKSDGTGTDVLPGTQSIISANNVYYAKWKYDAPHSYALRSTGPGGGLIFYDKGYYSKGWQYMEAAPADLGSTMMWCSGPLNGGYDPGTGPVTTANVGDGLSNTINAIAEYSAQSLTAIAAVSCDNYVNNGYADWFLPSQGEVILMYSNLYLQGVGGFKGGSNQYYWNSTEQQNSYWFQYSGVSSFATNWHGSMANNYNYDNLNYYIYVRPARRF